MKKYYEDGFDDQSLEKLEDDIMWNKTQRRELKDRIFINVETFESQEKMIPTKLVRIKQISLVRKLTYSVLAFIILFGLFVGSAFVSPAMANVVSNIPYMGQIFQSKPILGLINDELKEKGYNIGSIGIRYQPKKVIEVSIEGSDDYYKEVKDDVEKIVKGILKSRGYDAYSLNVNKFVAKKDYVLKVANTNEFKIYTTNVTGVPVNATKADKGTQIISTINEGLMSKKEYKVTEVGYTNKPLTFIIKTSILSSDPTAETLGTEIETMITEFVTSEEVSSILENEPYEIIVNSKDNKKIN
ncbi:DUF4030 domain-containing protein [Pseudalkalibacillus sp. A8]|uniref:DUF4030 domain-containing protein n=1 Tax=Pseudalkalibacillus sp. A8 TaxID=3382641 RepID=UPI0038B52C99